jgi:aspartyl-tRNA(Asn)/glutamyl-tRNA(Gln) amidotransferase subunit A
LAYASSLDQIGPLTKEVRDAAILLQAIAGHDPQDSTSIPAPVPDFSAALGKDLRGLKVGIPQEYFGEGLNPEVRAAVNQALSTLRDLGVELREVSLPHTPYAVAAYYVIAMAEASSNLARYDGVKYGLRAEGGNLLEMYANTRTQGFGAEVRPACFNGAPNGIPLLPPGKRPPNRTGILSTPILTLSTPTPTTWPWPPLPPALTPAPLSA